LIEAIEIQHRIDQVCETVLISIV